MKKEKLSFFFHCILHVWKFDWYNHQLISEEYKHIFTSFMSSNRRSQAVIIIPVKCTWKFSLFELIYNSLIDGQPNSEFYAVIRECEFWFNKKKPKRWLWKINYWVSLTHMHMLRFTVTLKNHIFEQEYNFIFMYSQASYSSLNLPLDILRNVK